MVDNRSAGFFGIGGSFNFKSGDISGTAAKTQDDKMGQGGEYFSQRKKDDEEESKDSEKYTDRSAVLRATLNSLAMMNVANVINERKKALSQKENEEENSQRHKNQQQEQKDKRENAEKELEEEFYNIAKELKEDK
ncbi:MAG: hypothetical protein BHW55_04930 [Candidatus Melainabacteria bacterium 35_41]|jgi:hypothetical protein|nr:MAG: hypothetical protein BHW55_04930 [Candidatus Melainabacteria bacterium 35_41]